tara:strand:- start:101 stop:373 length:273 start_codon:yes stop_codon:yes gene_type:complete
MLLHEKITPSGMTKQEWDQMVAEFEKVTDKFISNATPDLRPAAQVELMAFLLGSCLKNAAEWQLPVSLLHDMINDMAKAIDWSDENETLH